jgi:hypothetical protein
VNGETQPWIGFELTVGGGLVRLFPPGERVFAHVEGVVVRHDLVRDREVVRRGIGKTIALQQFAKGIHSIGPRGLRF